MRAKISYLSFIFFCEVPIVGMLCGATISGVVITINYVLKEIQLSIFYSSFTSS